MDPPLPTYHVGTYQSEKRRRQIDSVRDFRILGSQPLSRWTEQVLPEGALPSDTTNSRTPMASHQTSESSEIARASKALKPMMRGRSPSEKTMQSTSKHLICLLGLRMSACGNCGDDQPADLREFHGHPSSIICGQRWSHDHESFYCGGPALDLRDLAPFKRLRTVHITDSTVRGANSVSLVTVTSLSLNRVSMPGEDIASAFPELQSLSARGREFDVSSLPPMQHLAEIDISLATPPRAAAIALHPVLKTVFLSYLACDSCEASIAESIRQLRPDLEVEMAPKVGPR